MISAKSLAIYFKLQQVVLDTEDTSNLINLLLPQVGIHLASIGLSYEFVAASFVNADNQPQQSYFVDPYVKPGEVVLNNIVSLESLFAKGSVWENDLLWGRAIVTSEVGKLVYPSYTGFSKIQTLIISPVHFGKRLSGALILACSRAQDKISQEELEIIELVSHLVSLAFRIQDTQTSLTKITQEVYKMNAELHQMDKLKDDFVSIASHELRTPMTAIRSYTWMALNRSDIQLSEKMKKYLSRTLISTERLINLVNDMLNVSRIEAGRIEVSPKAFDIQGLVDETFGEVDAKANEKGIRLQVIKGQMPQVFADSDKVHQVLLNLLGNALKFTPPGGLIAVNFFTDGQVVEVAVKDTGTGISKEDLARLFKKFGRLDNSYVAAATAGGTGLGLYICKSLVDLMHGRIWAVSEGLGKGATFTFSVPAATPAVLAQAEVYTKKAVGEAKILEPVAI